MKPVWMKIWGVFLIILGFIVFNLRPYQNCRWWQLTCNANSFFSDVIFGIFMVVLIILGIFSLRAAIRKSSEW